MREDQRRLPPQHYYKLARLLVILAHIAMVTAQQINVINVAKDIERWQRAMSEFHRIGLLVSDGKEMENKDTTTKEGSPIVHVHRLEAVDGRSLSLNELKENASWGARLFCTSGTIGCYMSHRKFWEQTMKGNDSYQIVLEDDFVLTGKDFPRQAQARIEELEQEVGVGEWDVLLLGGLGCINPNKKYGPYNIPAHISGGCRTPKLISEHIHIPKRPFGTHAYALSQRGADKLLRLAWKATYHVDCVIWGIQDLDLYICDPLLVFQDTSPSTVGAITSGIETWIPDTIIMDDYTKMTFKWVWNEAVIRIPFFNVIITQGRYLLWGIFGTLLSIWQFPKQPWMLPTHWMLYFTFIVTFNRLINTPMGRD